MQSVWVDRMENDYEICQAKEFQCHHTHVGFPKHVIKIFNLILVNNFYVKKMFLYMTKFEKWDC